MWNKVVILPHMKLESVKLNSEVVEKVRKNKEKTGVSIGIFFEKAALQKLQREKKKKTA